MLYFGPLVSVGGQTSDVLMQVAIPVVNQQQCATCLGIVNQQQCATCLGIVNQQQCATCFGSGINDNMLCAGFAEGGKDTCQGDSGGPLACQNNGVWEVQGLTSFDEGGCSLPNDPAVFTRVTQYLDWINSVTSI